MTQEMRQEKLDRLEREILEKQAALSRQAALVDWLAAERQSTATAEALFEAIGADLATLIAQRMAIGLDGG